MEQRSDQSGDAGDGFLFEQGYSLLWSGWNWDVLPGDRRLQIELPVATENGAPITGTVAAEFVVSGWTRSEPFMWGNSRGYPPASLTAPDARLTVRTEPDAPRTEIPRDHWRFARLDGARLVPDPKQVFHFAGFEPGLIYEVVYPAQGPRVVGLGLAAIRDAISFFRFEAADATGTANPLAQARAPDPETALIFGISQSGRVIQHMLWQALHVDEAGRMVFDGALIHVAGAGKGSFNHRFAQTTRHPSHLEDQQYPADFFPFTTTPGRDPVTGAKGDVLERARAAGALPRLFYTTTSTEYWTRAASLLHTDVAGSEDVPLHPRARLYFLAGAQHGNWRFPERSPFQNCGNPLDHRPPMRALLLALDAWVSEDGAPPDSVYPKLAAGTLGSVEDYRRAFPKIPELAVPSGNLQPPRLDLGPHFANDGIADWQPPKFGPPYVTRVPLPDADGNDLGGIRLPDLAVPLGTYTGWNLRGPEIGAPDKLARWSGSFVPFAPTEAARRAAGDPRPSLEARYASRAEYRDRIQAAARELVTDGFLRADDVPGLDGARSLSTIACAPTAKMIRPAPTSSATECALALLRDPRLPCGPWGSSSTKSPRARRRDRRDVRQERRRPPDRSRRSRGAWCGAPRRAREEDIIDALLMRAPSAIRRAHAAWCRWRSPGPLRWWPATCRRCAGAPPPHSASAPESDSRNRVLPVDAAAADVEVAEHQDRVRRAVHLAPDERRQLFELAPAHRAVLGACLHMGDEDIDQVIVGAREAGVQDALGGEPVLVRSVAVDVAVDRDHGQPTGERELVADERQPCRVVRHVRAVDEREHAAGRQARGLAAGTPRALEPLRHLPPPLVVDRLLQGDNVEARQAFAIASARVVTFGLCPGHSRSRWRTSGRSGVTNWTL